ncbi:hypothetical protein NA57DRAFT_71454 [Rhizodiscina lignyota]|uniref:SnoaL-like domain-containing protein n=1 Tax=Rhizodiscina lignyota TaxID=1504668 RepID=A0A9P4IIW0_9PEZI|nr:hypothetical protein NA57DRAFT_71454 [Rhizodiscina lignyota]
MASNNSEESAILATCADFLNSMNTKDFAGMNNYINPEGHGALRRYGPDGSAIIIHTSLGDLVKRLEEITNANYADKTMEETFENPDVRIDDDLAMVWTNFRILVDGQQTAKGSNIFCLHKMGEKGWRISGVADRNTPTS